jgi:hypothetical protein
MAKVDKEAKEIALQSQKIRALSCAVEELKAEIKERRAAFEAVISVNTTLTEMVYAFSAKDEDFGLTMRAVVYLLENTPAGKMRGSSLKTLKSLRTEALAAYAARRANATSRASAVFEYTTHYGE